jgi:tetratricopeptide (TPR) repeat protein
MKRLGWKDTMLLAVTLAVVAAGTWWAWSENVVRRVFLVNRLGVPVEVSIDGKPHPLPLAALVPLSLDRGVHQVKVVAGGRVLEEGPVDLPGTSSVLAYNVLGVAPLYREAVYYGSGSANAPESFEFYGGRRLVAPGNADFVFTKPPASISVDSNASGPQVRWHFDLVDGGWQATVSILRSRNTRDEALRVCLDIARARPDDNEALLAAADLMSGLRGPDAAAGMLRAHLESHPDDLDVHRSHQHFLRRSGRAEEARSYYRSFRAARPGQAVAAVLLARVEAPETARALYEEALRLEPSNGLARRGLAHLSLTQGRFEDGARLLAEMEKDDPEYQYYVDDHVRSLLGANRPGEAVAVTARASEKYAADWRPAVLYAQLAASGAVTPPQPAITFIDRIAKKSQDPEFGWWMLSLAGQPIDDPRIRQAGRSPGPLVEAALIQQAAARDPALAWTLCAKAERPALERLGSPVAVLLAAEFRRAGDREAAGRLFAAESELNLPPAALEAYVMDGAEDPELWRLAPEVRAALDFVRSRRLADDAPASAALAAAARRREAVRGAVTLAIERWPPPERGAPTVTLRRRKAS